MTEQALESSRRTRLDGHMDSIAHDVSFSTGQPKGPIIDALKLMIQAFIGKLAAILGCALPDPVPPNPLTVQGKASDIAWHNAHVLKNQADQAFIEAKQDYRPAVLRQMASQIKRQRRKAGDPIDKVDAIESARAALDAARANTAEEIAMTILEAQGH